MRATRRNEPETKLDDDEDDTFEGNGDLGSFTALQVGPRALICATLRGLESEPTFDCKEENAKAMKNRNNFLLFF